MEMGDVDNRQRKNGTKADRSEGMKEIAREKEESGRDGAR